MTEHIPEMVAVHSSRPQTEQPAFTAWLEKAKRKWSGATFTGSGRYSVRLMDGKNIRLFETFEEATAFASQDPKYRFDDLSLEPVRMRTIPEPFDVDEMRRERREKAHERQ
jgi:hypothetical protein